VAKYTYSLFPAPKLRAFLIRLATIKASGARQTQFDGQMVTFRTGAELQAEIDAIGAQLDLIDPIARPVNQRRRRRGVRVTTSNKGFR
jgi:hypothetical protein